MADPLERVKVQTAILLRSEHVVDPEWPDLTMCGKRLRRETPRCKTCDAAIRKRLSESNS
jgi:hypothetical protein